MNKKYFVTEFEQRLIEACNSSVSMAQACARLQINHNTFITHAKRLGVYKPNQSGKGIKKGICARIQLTNILSGLHPSYQTYKLAIRLLKSGIKDHKCEKCCNLIWNGKPIPLELHHLDGNRFNHCIENLQLLCPNCHSQTDTYKSKNTLN